MVVAVGASSFSDTSRQQLTGLISPVLPGDSDDERPLLPRLLNGADNKNPFGRKLTEEETIAHLQGADGLLAGLEPLNERVFSACPQLKAIARIGIGMDQWRG